MTPTATTPVAQPISKVTLTSNPTTAITPLAQPVAKISSNG